MSDNDELLKMLINTKKISRKVNSSSTPHQTEFYGLVGDLITKIEIKFRNKPELFDDFNKFKDLYLIFHDDFVDKYLSDKLSLMTQSSQINLEDINQNLATIPRFSNDSNLAKAGAG